MNKRVAIITGGANGIGKETALNFAQEGYQVVIWDLDEKKGEETLKELQQSCPTAAFYSIDITDYQKVDSLTAEIKEKFGGIHVLINNAGITMDSTLKKMTPEQFSKVLDVNLKGVFNCGKAISLVMTEQNDGVIINTSSVVAHYGNFGQSNYVATKSGVIGMTKVWARELGKYNIRVNAVAPGFIETEMILTVPEKVLDGLRQKSPLNRLGKPVDIANAYLFLASEKAEYITGTVINVDGGLTL